MECKESYINKELYRYRKDDDVGGVITKQISHTNDTRQQLQSCKRIYQPTFFSCACSAETSLEAAASLSDTALESWDTQHKTITYAESNTDNYF